MKKRHITWRERWRRWRLQAVERYYFELKDNSTHPFEDLGDGFYYITVRSDKFAFGVGLIVLTVICFTAFCIFVDFYSFPLALFLIVISYGLFSMYGHLSTKELILSRYGGYLMRIKGSNKILVEEPIHNCYIKLQRKFDSDKEPHYYLILGGYGLDDIRISSMASHDGALRLLGSRLAARMGINYFDCENNSTLHRIIHYPSFTTMKPTDEEYNAFLREHKIDEEDVIVAAIDEDLPMDSNIPPNAIVRKIKDNYMYGSHLNAVVDRKRRNVSEEDVRMLERTARLRDLLLKRELEKTHEKEIGHHHHLKHHRSNEDQDQNQEQEQKK